MVEPSGDVLYYGDNLDVLRQHVPESRSRPQVTRAIVQIPYRRRATTNWKCAIDQGANRCATR